ncbi:MAG: TolC family outer membrane protein [Hyphomicrobiales bacterium]|nr:TolC family outer membrane protein [Hyphomicrobiales bacterium]
MSKKQAVAAVRRHFWRMHTLSAVLVACLGVSIAPVDVAEAETLQEALAAAYLYNPTLKAARAELRSTDEGVPLARSNYRPTVIGNVSQTYSYSDVTGGGPNSDTDVNSYGVTLSQPIFRGFRTRNAIRGAEAQVEAGRESLRDAEQDVLLLAVTSYVNVVRDGAVLSLQRSNRRVLEQQQRATKDRFQVGEVTRTDVAQADARVSGATSAISAAQALLQASRATYAQIIGHMPTNLSQPGPARELPGSLEEAIAIAEGENPQILEALFLERAQQHAIDEIKGELLPSVNLEATYDNTEGGGGVGGTQGRTQTTTVSGVLSVPIYQAGQVSARIRSGIETRAQLRHLIDAARESVRAAVISAWGDFTAAQAQIASDRAQVEATDIALRGVREEEKVGQRTVLDVLNAEQDALDAQVDLVTSRRDYIVASYALLDAMGRLSAATIKLPVEQYDATQNYREVERKWIGWSTSVEEGEWETEVAPVTASGKTPEQQSGDGPAYTVR